LVNHGNRRFASVEVRAFGRVYPWQSKRNIYPLQNIENLLLFEDFSEFHEISHKALWLSYICAGLSIDRVRNNSIFNGWSQENPAFGVAKGCRLLFVYYVLSSVYNTLGSIRVWSVFLAVCLPDCLSH
jgi:hypothetical protein